MTDEENLLEQGIRFQKLVKTLNHNGKTLAIKLVVSQPLISQVISGKRGITKFLVEKLTACYPDVNINWLYTGKGEMFLPVETPEIMVNEYTDVYNLSKKNTIDQLPGILDSMQQEITDLQARITELENKILA